MYSPGAGYGDSPAGARLVGSLPCLCRTVRVTEWSSGTFDERKGHIDPRHCKLGAPCQDWGIVHGKACGALERRPILVRNRCALYQRPWLVCFERALMGGTPLWSSATSALVRAGSLCSW